MRVVRTGGIVALALVVGCIQSERRVSEGPTDTTSGGDTTTTGDGVTTTSATDSATGVEDGATGCDGCLIGETCVPADTPNPEDDCQVCAPGRDADGWSTAADDSPCDDDDPCTGEGTCDQGQCAAPLLPDCGVLPACASDIACDEDGCFYVLVGRACYIDGECREEGALMPGNPCRWCEPDRDQRDWSDNDGRVCDDDDACTYEDTCEDGECLGTENDCGDPYACTLDFCDEGQCRNMVDVHACLIEDACHQDDAPSPDAPCRVCDPLSNQRAWTVTPDADCDDHDVCTKEDACDASGRCLGTRIVRGAEPNEEPSQATLIDEGVTTYPAGDLELNLSPLTDRDFVSWSMPLAAVDGVRRPTTRVANDALRDMKSCVYAACGQVLNALVKPTVVCGGLSAEVLGPVAGCCDTVPPGEQRTVAIEAVCPDGGTVQQGMAFASVRFVSNVAAEQAPTCGDYTIEWGAALKL
ncbi:MAG: hypothetical protein IT385_25415 [Deltaproteobacteria bacterium]|nr:hypothetical protein [Deltaproteobacteria bacterium]